MPVRPYACHSPRGTSSRGATAGTAAALGKLPSTRWGSCSHEATATAVKNGHYNQAVTLLEQYIAKMGDYLALGNTRPEVSLLMINQATTLKNLIAAQVQ